MNLMRKVIQSTVVALAGFAVVQCSGETAVYEATPENLYKGSLYYAKSENNCKNCHGTGWDGNGPEAKNLKADGIEVPGFTGEIAASKTPADYFKAITTGTEKTKSLPKGHAYQSHTDRARWAMANFLYSLAKPVPSNDPEALAVRQEALKSSMAEVKEIYSKQRRWDMGYKPVAEREKAPSLAEMNANPVQGNQAAEVTQSVMDNAKKAANANPDGYRLYTANCAGCHGTYGQGGKFQRFGLVAGSGDGVAGITRMDPVFVTIPPLGRVNAGQIAAPHTEAASIAQPSYNLAEGQLETLSNYINALAEK